MPPPEPWMDDPGVACKGVDAELFFPTRGSRLTDTQAAKAVCRRCPVQRPCLWFAVNDPAVQGIWGGASMKERNAIRMGRKSDTAVLGPGAAA